jgi:uncharacterized protein involved in exopolysaccharide biosynthesis
MIDKHKLYPVTKNFQDSIDRFQKDVKLDVKMRGFYPEGPESVTICFRHTDKVIAQQVMDDMVASFEEANQEIRRLASSEANRMTEKIVEIEERLRGIAPQQSLAMIRNQQANQAATDAAIRRSERRTAESTVETLSDREYALQRQITDVQQQIEEQEKIVKARPANGPATNPAIGALLVRKADLEAQINIYLKQYTEKNPKVVAAREQLTQIIREMSRLESSSANNEGSFTFTPEMSELKRLRQQLRQYETDLEVVRRELGRKSQVLERIPVVAGGGSFGGGASTAGVGAENRTEYDRLLVRYNALQEKHDALMKLAGIAGSGAPMFQIIDTPNKPEYPIAPNRMMLRLLALALSVAFGLLIAFAFEFPRLFMLNDERDVEYYLGAPVMALIPETTTPIERSRNRRLRWTRGLIFVLIAAGLIPALIVVLTRVQIFQIIGSK